MWIGWTCMLTKCDQRIPHDLVASICLWHFRTWSMLPHTIWYHMSYIYILYIRSIYPKPERKPYIGNLPSARVSHATDLYIFLGKVVGKAGALVLQGWQSPCNMLCILTPKRSICIWVCKVMSHSSIMKPSCLSLIFVWDYFPDPMLLSLWWWRPSTKCFSWSHSSAVFSWIDCWVESMRCVFHIDTQCFLTRITVFVFPLAYLLGGWYCIFG